MKLLLTIALLLATTANAQNFMRYADFKDGLTRGFQLQADCERGGFECFNADLDKLDEQSVVFDDVDDITKPKYAAASNITPCAAWRECGELVTSLCAANELGFFRYLEETKTYEAYCTSIVGYEQKKQPKLAENTQKKQAKQTKATEREARRAARASGEARMARLAGQSDLTAAESREVALWLLRRQLQGE